MFFRMLFKKIIQEFKCWFGKVCVQTIIILFLKIITVSCPVNLFISVVRLSYSVLLLILTWVSPRTSCTFIRVLRVNKNTIVQHFVCFINKDYVGSLFFGNNDRFALYFSATPVPKLTTQIGKSSPHNEAARSMKIYLRILYWRSNIRSLFLKLHGNL